MDELDCHNMRTARNDPLNYREFWTGILYRGDAVDMVRTICLDRLGRQSHTTWHIIGAECVRVSSRAMEDARAFRLFR